MRTRLLVAALCLLALSAQAAVQNQAVEYKDGDTTLTGQNADFELNEETL